MNREKVISWLVVGINIVLLTFSYKFWCWALWLLLVLIFLIYIGYYALTTKKLRVKEPFYKIKAFFARLLVLVIAVGGLYFYYWIGWYKVFLDIPAYLENRYQVIEGIPSGISSIRSKSVMQVIEINGVKLESHLLNLKPASDIHKKFKIYYLPYSKFVMGIWVFDR